MGMSAKLKGAAPTGETVGSTAPCVPVLPWRTGGRRLPMPSLRLRTVIDPDEPWPRTGDAVMARAEAALFGTMVVEGITAEARAFVIDMLEEAPGPSIGRLAADLSVAVAPNRLVAAHELAAARLAEGRDGDAALLLTALVTWRSGAFDGLLGLAALATSAGRPAAARRFGQDAMTLGVRHPSAYCIVGLALLALGERRAAQAMLAAAARVARGDPRYRDDMDAAQRTLLLMQLT